MNCSLRPASYRDNAIKGGVEPHSGDVQCLEAPKPLHRAGCALFRLPLLRDAESDRILA